jgi:hypothetical protein
MDNPIIENWVINQIMLGEKMGGYYLQGNIYNHPNPRILQGEKASTSELKSIDFENNKAVTLNTTYILGLRDT